MIVVYCHCGQSDGLELNQHFQINFERIQYCKLEADHTPDKDSGSVREVYHLHFLVLSI